MDTHQLPNIDHLREKLKVSQTHQCSLHQKDIKYYCCDCLDKQHGLLCLDCYDAHPTNHRPLSADEVFSTSIHTEMHDLLKHEIDVLNKYEAGNKFVLENVDKIYSKLEKDFLDQLRSSKQKLRRNLAGLTSEIDLSKTKAAYEQALSSSFDNDNNNIENYLKSYGDIFQTVRKVSKDKSNPLPSLDEEKTAVVLKNLAEQANRVNTLFGLCLNQMERLSLKADASVSNVEGGVDDQEIEEVGDYLEEDKANKKKKKKANKKKKDAMPELPVIELEKINELVSKIQLEEENGLLTIKSIAQVFATHAQIIAPHSYVLLTSYRKERRKYCKQPEKYVFTCEKYLPYFSRLNSDVYAVMFDKLKISAEKWQDSIMHHIKEGKLHNDYRDRLYNDKLRELFPRKPITLPQRKICYSNLLNYLKNNMQDVAAYLMKNKQLATAQNFPHIGVELAFDDCFEKYGFEEEEFMLLLESMKVEDLDKEIMNMFLKFYEVVEFIQRSWRSSVYTQPQFGQPQPGQGQKQGQQVNQGQMFTPQQMFERLKSQGKKGQKGPQQQGEAKQQVQIPVKLQGQEVANVQSGIDGTGQAEGGSGKDQGTEGKLGEKKEESKL